jgi:hypothetical protein
MNSEKPFPMVDEEENLLHRLTQIEKALSLLAQQRLVKDFYTTSEIAELLNKSAFTVREWCRHGRIVALKRACGRGRTCEWIVSNAELLRIKNHGLLPLDSINRVGLGVNHGAN